MKGDGLSALNCCLFQKQLTILRILLPLKISSATFKGIKF